MNKEQLKNIQKICSAMGVLVIVIGLIIDQLVVYLSGFFLIILMVPLDDLIKKRKTHMFTYFAVLSFTGYLILKVTSVI